ncbi:MAG TPA: phospholipase D-like domain-containing protein [Candidatus Dormibacteraeota bacterium]|nr:phospholipase D-like domain-containing protein [Candidatus Dormibacteraeota bacterium]
MPSITSTAAFLGAVQRARRIDLCAYSLAPGKVENALIAAARRGAEVSVTLAGAPSMPSGLAHANSDALARLSAAGARTHEVTSSPGTFHAKLARVDAALYLDDRNWSDSGDTILRDLSVADRRGAMALLLGAESAKVPGAQLALDKRAALAKEMHVLAGARRGEEADISTESFGFSPQVYSTLLTLARRGVRANLLVARSDVAPGSLAERALQRLAQHGVLIRLGVRCEKLACIGERAWIGSANATYAPPQAVDWGIELRAGALVTKLRSRFCDAWARARPYEVETSAGKSARAVASVRASVSSRPSASSVASLRAV